MPWAGPAFTDYLESRATMRNPEPVLRQGDFLLLKYAVWKIYTHLFMRSLLVNLAEMPRLWIDLFTLHSFRHCNWSKKKPWIDWEIQVKNQSCSIYQHLFSDTWSLYTPALHWQWRLCFFKKNRISLSVRKITSTHILAQRTLRNIISTMYLFYSTTTENRTIKLTSLFWTGSLNNAMSEFVLNLKRLYITGCSIDLYILTTRLFDVPEHLSTSSGPSDCCRHFHFRLTFHHLLWLLLMHCR